MSTSSRDIVSHLRDLLSQKHETSLDQFTQKLDALVSRTLPPADKIVIKSVVPLSQKQRDAIVAFLHGFGQPSLPVVCVIDRSLLGGFTVSVRDWFLDASIRSHLNRLKHILLV